jgi:N-glycosylase/DNA lyase
MNQRVAVLLGCTEVHIELPGPSQEVLPGVLWGRVEAFPTPAYWAYQVLARRVLGRSIRNRIGRTLREEVGACLLGGHGIPANVGLAAFEHLRSAGVFGEAYPAHQDELLKLLKMPLQCNGKLIQYRFASQKARYIASALAFLNSQREIPTVGRALRDWLLEIDGIGLKTASWIARNWLDADDVAILDIHLLRAGVLMNVFPRTADVTRNYLELEQRFLHFSQHLGTRASELDAVIWHEMMMSPASVAAVMTNDDCSRGLPAQIGLPRTKQRRANATQASLLV